MTERVPADEIEGIVGRRRDLDRHFARAVSAEQTVYILHSHECLVEHEDLRECLFSVALDAGIDVAEWVEDEALVVEVHDGRLRPKPTYPRAVQHLNAAAAKRRDRG